MKEIFDNFSSNGKYLAIQQRINQTNSEAGIPAVLDFSLEDAVLKQLNRNQVEQTWDQDKRRLCANTVEEHLRSRDPHDDFPAGPCALFGFDPRIPFSLDEYTIDALIEEYLSEHYRYVCDVSVSIFCDNAAKIVEALGFGEWTCLYRYCKHCWGWFNLPQEQREKTQKPGWPFAHPGQEFRHPAT